MGGASEEEKNEENAQVIARALMTAAGRIRKNQLSPEQMTAVGLYPKTIINTVLNVLLPGIE